MARIERYDTEKMEPGKALLQVLPELYELQDPSLQVDATNFWPVLARVFQLSLVRSAWKHDPRCIMEMEQTVKTQEASMKYII